MRQSILSFILLFCISNSLLGQSAKSFPGFIIDLKGDTIIGEIKDLDWVKTPSIIEFSLNNESDFKNYHPQEIIGFYASESKKEYFSYNVELNVSSHTVANLTEIKFPKIESKTIFLEPVTYSDQIRVYRYIDAENKSHFFISTNNEVPIELIHHKYKGLVDGKQLVSGTAGEGIIEVNKYVGQLNYYLQDCSSISKIIGDLDYSTKAIKNLMHKYYDCIGDSTSLIKKKETTPPTIAVFGGFNISKLNFRTDFEKGLLSEISNRKVPVGIGPNIGVSAAVPLPGRFNRLHFIFSANYFFRSISEEFTYVSSGNGISSLTRNHVVDYKIANHFLNFSTGLQVNFLQEKKISPFIKILATTHFSISEKRYLSDKSWEESTPELVNVNMDALVNDDREKFLISPAISFGVKINNFFTEASLMYNLKGVSNLVAIKDSELYFFYNCGYRFTIGKNKD